MRRAASVLVGVDAQENRLADHQIFLPTGFFADEAVSV